MRKKYFFWIGILLLSVLLPMTFADNPFADYAGTDSAVFFYVGAGISRGIVPYKDVFDHKGFLIYAINWLGSFVAPSLIGVWIVESLLCIVSLIVVWRFASKYFDRESAYIALFPYCALFSFGNMGGNFTETYAHFFIVPILLWVIIHAVDATPFTKFESFVAGICFGAILMLRPNMGVFAIVVAFYFLYTAMYDRRVMLLCTNTAFVVFGLLAFLLPFIAYLYVNDAMLDCWRCYIEYNIGYAINTASLGPVFYIACLLSVVGVLPCMDKKWRCAATFNLIFLVLTTCLLAMNSSYKHYLLMIVPGAVLPLAWCVKRLDSLIAWKYSRSVIVVVSLLFISKEAMQANFDVGGYMRHIKATHRLCDLLKFKEGAEYDCVGRLAKEIDCPDSVTVVGNDCELYRRMGFTSRNYYVYAPYGLDKEIGDELKSCKSKYIITSGKSYPDRFKSVLDENYDKVGSFGIYTLYKSRI